MTPALVIFIGLLHLAFNRQIAVRTLDFEQRHGKRLNPKQVAKTIRRDRIITVLVGAAFVAAGSRALLD